MWSASGGQIAKPAICVVLGCYGTGRELCTWCLAFTRATKAGRDDKGCSTCWSSKEMYIFGLIHETSIDDLLRRLRFVSRLCCCETPWLDTYFSKQVKSSHVNKDPKLSVSQTGCVYHWWYVWSVTGTTRTNLQTFQQLWIIVMCARK